MDLPDRFPRKEIIMMHSEFVFICHSLAHPAFYGPVPDVKVRAPAATHADIKRLITANRHDPHNNPEPDAPTKQPPARKRGLACLGIHRVRLHVPSHATWGWGRQHKEWVVQVRYSNGIAGAKRGGAEVAERTLSFNGWVGEKGRFAVVNTFTKSSIHSAPLSATPASRRFDPFSPRTCISRRTCFGSAAPCPIHFSNHFKPGPSLFPTALSWHR